MKLKVGLSVIVSLLDHFKRLIKVMLDLRGVFGGIPRQKIGY